MSISLFALAEKTPEKSNESKTIVNSVTKKQKALLSAVDKRYQKEHGIHIELVKKVFSEILGTTKESSGEVWLNNGQMQLSIKKPEPSKVVVTKEFLWIERGKPKDFKDAKVQVIQAPLNSPQAKSQGLIQILTKGGLLKYFKTVGVQSDKGKVSFFLQPNKQAVEFKRLHLEIDAEKKEILKLSYWDQMDNETSYFFNKTQFNQKFDKKLFVYQPPKDAEVINN